MLCTIFNTSTLSHPSTSPWGNGRMLQAGITYADMTSCHHADKQAWQHDGTKT
ncbi:hypothetical protein NXV24_26750 (plasmid) [Bacteroides thetaiotaomicron]|uniref:hypothetical protein n=1 Tax=Bacteroides thetaiotaomicron TaxID=818 RepID=UPI002166A939|nr:hypothetical protein [Bacteroides thetaiotaomicron]MCS2399893.1 hypothetical protein [Bacteroides thetaiotaomicron]MDY4424944.1 hypothetical protein [Bacteroides uniformis]